MRYLATMYQKDVELQIIFSFVLGLLSAPLSYGIDYTIIFIIFFELYVFLITSTYPPCVKIFDRILINFFFLFGWIISRVIFNGEVGIEKYF
jgi:hypothetical protein